MSFGTKIKEEVFNSQGFFCISDYGPVHSLLNNSHWVLFSLLGAILPILNEILFFREI